MLRRALKIDRAFPLLTSEIIGMLAFVLLTIPLSILGILNRTVCSLLILVSAIPGILLLYGKLKSSLPRHFPPVIHVIFGLFFAFVLIINLTYASMPSIAFDDPLITYAVQPDRWLNTGRIYWIEETTFSGFPLLYEMTAVWPASLSTDRLNQLSVLQVFQLSILLVCLFRCASILKVQRGYWLPLSAIVLLTSALYYWCSLAKTDTYAILFCTLAISSAVRQRDPGFTGSPLSSWLFMGLALATKQTSVIILIPFFLYSAGTFLRFSWKVKVLAVASLLTVPMAFGIRTMLKTGSPLYPVNTVDVLLKPGWELNDPDEQTTLNTRSSSLYESRDFSIAKHIGIFFGAMEGNILLLIAGAASAFLRRKWKDACLAVPLFFYFAIAIAVFWPPWWGYKYSILIYPITALLGIKLMPYSKTHIAIVSLILAVSFYVPGFLVVASEGRAFVYRKTVAQAVLSGSWDESSGYRSMGSTPENTTHMWANSMFTTDTVIFSIHEEKRYFFDGTVIVGWRHPLGQKLYLDNSLAEELSILDSLNVDYVGFYRTQPSILGQENRLEILGHIGIGCILEPVVIVDGGYLLCRYDSSLL